MPVQLQPPVPPPVVVEVKVSHADWHYRVGDTALFTLRTTQAGRPVAGVPLVVQYGAERMRAQRVDTLVSTMAGVPVRAALPEPGFLRLTARPLASSPAPETSAMATVGFSAEAIEARVDNPSDFDAFWREAVAAARHVPLEPRLTERPDLSTPDVLVYHVAFQNHKVGSRLYGMLSVPRRPGRYPAILKVPGAGVRPYFPNVGLARRGIVHLTIGIHGIPVDRDSLLYNELRVTALSAYNAIGVDDRDTYYYKRVFVGVVRAGDFLLSLPQVDTSRYAVEGGSQGGALALVAAALDPRVKAISVTHPAMGDQLAYRFGRAGGWPHLFQDTTRLAAKELVARTIPYYDAVNFARRVRVPGIYSWGFNDLTVPPTAMYAIYNAVTAPSELFVVKEIGHIRVPEQVRRMDDWLLRLLGDASGPGR